MRKKHERHACARTKSAYGSPSPAQELKALTIHAERKSLEIPGWVTDLASFRRWVNSDDYPEKIRICYLNGHLWVDLGMEEFFAHNQTKGEFTRVWGNLAKESGRGRCVPDGMLVTNEDANLSCEPDCMFVSRASLDSGKVRLVPNKKGRLLELQGTPDAVLEVVSPSSVGKDYEVLRELYWKAGIPEFWLVDVRDERMSFDILRHTTKGYVATRKHNGWIKSAVFGKSFRLLRQLDDRGEPEFTLEVK